MRKLFIVLLVPMHLAGQSLPDSTAKKIDSLFSAYTTFLIQKETLADNSNIVNDSILLKRFPGTYYSERGNSFKLARENKKLFSRGVMQSAGGTEWKLIPKENNIYQRI